MIDLRDLDQAKAFAAAFKARLIAELGEDVDPELIDGTIEGETDLYELLAKAARDALQAEAMAVAIQSLMNDNVSRKERMIRRAEKLRAAVKAAMSDLEIKRRDYPDMTLSLAPGRPRLIIQSDAQSMPTEFTRLEVVIDKPKIALALQDGGKLDFAHYTVPEPSLRILTK